MTSSSLEAPSPSAPTASTRIAYLFARYPNPAQPYCDTELLALDALGVDLEIDVMTPAGLSFRHERCAEHRIDTRYLVPPALLKARALQGVHSDRSYAALVLEYERRHGVGVKPERLLQQALGLLPGLERRGVAHVHAHFVGRAARVATFIKRISGLSFSVTSHGPHFHETPAEVALLQETAEEAEFVVAVSDWSLERLRATCPANAHKFVRVYNGLDARDFPRRSEGEQRRRPRIVSVGRLVEFKGFHVLLRACAALRRRGLDFECTLVGEGPYRATLEASIRELSLAGTVELVGLRTQSQVRSTLARSDVFVLAAVVDGQGACDVLPTVILEAMATGLPVVSTRVGGIPELVENDVTGSLVAPDEPDALAAALERLLSSPERRDAWGKAARDRFDARFTSAAAAAELLEHFRGALTRGPQRLAPSPPAAFVMLVDRWPLPADEALEAEVRGIARRADACVLVCELDEDLDSENAGPDPATAARLEVLPDPVVLETRWLESIESRTRFEELRPGVPRRLRGEEYYRDARRALWIADWLRRSSITHLHAARGRAVLCAWLVKKLLDIRVTFSLGEGDGRRRRAHVRLAADLDSGSYPTTEREHR